MKKQIKAIISLFAICAVTALLLALTNYFTAPIIKKAEDSAANAALLEVMPNGEDFKSVDLSSYTLPSSVLEAFSEKNGGYVIKLSVTGYAPGMIIMCGVNADLSISGAVCLSSGETLGYEKTFGSLFAGKTSETVDEVATISGATKTTGAYRGAIKDAINASIILAGGSADFRTEEEIFADNLAAALPAGEGKFAPYFIAEEIVGIDAIYAADNASGFVYIVGESFIGVDASGKVISDVTAELKTTVETAAAILAESTLTELDLSTYTDLPSQLLSASKTASGNYVLTVRGAGYGINGGNQWHPASGEYIIVKISMTAEGKIINCITLSQKESEGIGDACADTDFSFQFNGKTESNYSEIDAISGATITTEGYKKAVLNAFKAVTILNGGDEQ